MPTASPCSSFQQNSLFTVLPVPVRLVNGEILLESQSHHGLDMYARHFDAITVCQPLLPESMVKNKPWDWKPASKLKFKQKIAFQPLPWGYKPGDHIGSRNTVSKILDSNILNHQYLKFSIGGLFGDWASMACLRAHKLNRDYAVWADRIEHRVVSKTRKEVFSRKIKNLFTVNAMSLLEKKVVRSASVGLFNGYEVWNYYQAFNPNSYQMYDIHTNSSHHINEQDLTAKLEELNSGAPLKICYAGRLDAMKAPLEWIECLHALKQLGVKFEAIWMGGGDQMSDMKSMRDQYQLNDCLDLPGFMSNHNQVLSRIKECHIFLFTHVTPESPRCLMESLVSGTAIVGYGSDYSRNLIEQHGGGSLVPMHDTRGLSKLLGELNHNRKKLALMTQQAAGNGKRFSDTNSFDRRVELIKKYT